MCPALVLIIIYVLVQIRRAEHVDRPAHMHVLCYHSALCVSLSSVHMLVSHIDKHM